eukprot:TRINITY_DN3726_c0_g1_i18.p1 TRINITY_DN3726_c0_g1~~TRINITY_DN3726_c0_g1_i18.p1  ORF type:complete len:127 (-),score=18.66 TRINITY_DN3726_c0_g1_i18:515-895(-)
MAGEDAATHSFAIWQHCFPQPAETSNDGICSAGEATPLYLGCWSVMSASQQTIRPNSDLTLGSLRLDPWFSANNPLQLRLDPWFTANNPPQLRLDPWFSANNPPQLRLDPWFSGLPRSQTLLLPWL